MQLLKTNSVVIILILLSANSMAQRINKDSVPVKKVAAGPNYERSGFHHWLWGTNYRKEWATPVQVPLMRLDTAYGGLQPVKTGGGNETKSLQLKDKDGREYTLRTINKNRKPVIPPMFKGTYGQDVVQDAVSMSHPYGALTVPVMLQRAGLYHARPVIVYLPQQPALDTFNDKYANDLYLFEQRSDGDWSTAGNFGHAKDFRSTEKLVKKLLKDEKGKPDQYIFVKSRLFDMMIGDWDRHEDNWRWIEKDSADQTWHVPVPRDRDQVYFKHNGWLANVMMSAAGIKYMQNFDHKVKRIADLNWEQRNLDRFFANEMTNEDWQRAASELQQALTDDVIEQAIKQLPPEIYDISGKETADKLKTRREQLPRFAYNYYRFLAREVEITGSEERELFEVSRPASGQTSVVVYRLDKSGQKKDKPYYQRTFDAGETKEIRIYGIDGEDVYAVSDHANGTTLRVIGGPAKDSGSLAGRKVHVYDNHDNDYTGNYTRRHLSNDSSVHEYKYKSFNYDKGGLSPSVFYSYEDRLFVGLKYKLKTYRWRKEPFASQQSLAVNYSISQTGISITYNGMFPKLIGGWDLLLYANYDPIRWTNYYGKGNESVLTVKDPDYHRMRSEEYMGSGGLQRVFGKNVFSVTGYYQHAKLINDSGRFATKVFEHANPTAFDPVSYAGLRLEYTYTLLNDSVIPTKGFAFLANGAVNRNLTDAYYFQTYHARVNGYIPISNKFSLAIRAGGTTVIDDNEGTSPFMYEYAVIGGPRSMKGFRRERFWGKTAYFNNNELRYMTDFSTKLLKGKVGLLAFFDNGRVWLPGEKSDVLHTAWGAGVLLAPFNKALLSLTYGVSKETSLIQVRLHTLFF